MMSEELVTFLGTVFLGVSAVAAVAFMVLYTLLARWWQSREGWYLMMSSLAFAVILTFNFAVVQGWLGRDTSSWIWLRLAIYILILMVMLWRPVLLLGAQAEIWKVRKEWRKHESS